jgi:hypothetical protein
VQQRRAYTVELDLGTGSAVASDAVAWGTAGADRLYMFILRIYPTGQPVTWYLATCKRQSGVILLATGKLQSLAQPSAACSTSAHFVARSSVILSQ